MSTTTTEISSNSNSSCRLLECLKSIPFQDQRVFRSQLGHIELLLLSACCRSLRSSIRNDPILWRELYHRDFLSGAYYTEEMEFVLWCIRTDVNNPCTSDKRADLLENVDWYNTYRRRVSTENNRRYGRCNITNIDMERDEHGPMYHVQVDGDRIFITQRNRIGRAPGLRRQYTLEYLPHSNLRSSNNIVYDSTFSTSPNVLSLAKGNEDQYNYVFGDHYIAVLPDVIKKNTNYNVKILSRKNGGVFTTFDVPAPYEVMKVEGKWALVVNKSQKTYPSLPIYDIMVFDIESSVMCPGSIDDKWGTTCFYQTTNNTAIVYTTRLVKVKYDDVHRIEWALYQFSSNNPVVQLRNGWFRIFERQNASEYHAQSSYNSHITIKLRGNPYDHSYMVHSVASSGQNHIPLNCYDISDHYIPIPLLRAGCRFSMFDSYPATVLTDLSYGDDQILQIPGTTFTEHIIGDLYIFYVEDHNRIGDQFLIDISTKEIIRKLSASKAGEYLDTDTMFGTIYISLDDHESIIQEYGEL